MFFGTTFRRYPPRRAHIATHFAVAATISSVSVHKMFSLFCSVTAAPNKQGERGPILQRPKKTRRALAGRVTRFLPGARACARLPLPLEQEGLSLVLALLTRVSAEQQVLSRGEQKACYGSFAGPRGLRSSHHATCVVDTIETGDSARDSAYQPMKEGGANHPPRCRPRRAGCMETCSSSSREAYASNPSGARRRLSNPHILSHEKCVPRRSGGDRDRP